MALFKGLSIGTLAFYLFQLLPGDVPSDMQDDFSHLKIKIPDVTTAHQMADFSYKIYDINSVFSPLIPRFLSPILFIQTGNSPEVFIGANDDEGYLLVAFRGSEETVDWFAEFDLVTSTFGPFGDKVEEAGRVHKGYNKAIFNGLYGQIEKIIRNTLETRSGYYRNNYDIHVAGHGSGGAMSLLTGVMLARTFAQNNVSVFTFGQPRLAMRKFTKWTYTLRNLVVWRFVLKDDPVPRTPNRNKGYMHVGHLIQLEDDGATLYYRQTGGGGFFGAPDSWYLNKKGTIVNLMNRFFLKHIYSAGSSLEIFSSLAEDNPDEALKRNKAEEYLRYIEEKSLKLPNVYYVSVFAT